MDDEVKTAQENLRLSANQNQKIMQELNDYKMRINNNNQENEQLKGRIQKLMGENTSLGDEVRTAQENLRLSANQMQKLNMEINEYKTRINSNNQESETFRQKIQKLMNENTSLGE